jgi:tetratricopeptide (TPR) repeat protein
MADCRLAIRIDPEWAEPYCAAGLVAKDAHRDAEGLALFTEAIALSSGYANAYFQRAHVHYSEDRYALALPDFAAAAQLDPEHYKARLFYGICLEETEAYDRALEAFDRARELDPSDDEAYYEYGLTCSKMGRYDEAISNMLISIALDTNNYRAVRNIGYAYRQKGDFEGAIPWFERVVARHPDNTLAHYNLGYCAAMLGHPTQAVEHLTTAIACNPEYCPAYKYRAYVYNHYLHDQERAADDYMTMAAMKADDAVALEDILSNLVRTGVETAVYTVANAVLEQNPRCASAYVHRALVDAWRGNYSNALADASTALAVDPDYVLTYSALHRIYKRMGDYAHALDNLEIYVTATTNKYPRVAYELGCLLNAAGRYRDAIPQLTRAMITPPMMYTAPIERAFAYASLGMYTNALMDVQAVPSRFYHVGLRRTRAVAHTALRMYSNAIADCDILVRCTEGAAQSKVRAVRARSYLALGMTNEANADIDFCEQYGVDPNIAITSILQRVDRF